jgi:RNA polymerase sigma-70 factor (ECF subfamily)
MADGRTTSSTLLDRVRGHDQAAWQRLMYLYAPLVRYWCGRWGVQGADADDVVQEVFQGVAAGLPGFRRDRPSDTFRGWLRGITRFKVLDAQRARQRHPVGAGGTEANLRMEQYADPQADDDTVAEPGEELSGLYHRAMELVRSEFEPQTWTAFWRAAVDNHPVDLIAGEMGVTPAAIRKAKSRVLRRLKEEIGDLID